MWSSKSFTLRATLLCLESCAGSFVWLLCFLALASTVAFAQVSRLTGQVTDESGAAVPGADVVLTNMGTAIARTAVTSNAGNYELVELPPGVYEATVTKIGFEVARQSNITIIVNQTARLDRSQSGLRDPGDNSYGGRTSAEKRKCDGGAISGREASDGSTPERTQSSCS